MTIWLRAATASALVCVLCGTGLAAQLANIGFNPTFPLRAIFSQRELDAHDGIADERDPPRRQRKIVDFLETYPDSELQYFVLRLRWQNIIDLERDPEDIIAAAERALESQEYFLERKMSFASERWPDPNDVPQYRDVQLDMANAKVGFYRSMLDSYLQLDDVEKAIEFAERALTFQDEAWIWYSEAADADAPEYQETLQRKDKVLAGILLEVFTLYQNASDVEKVIEYGERILEVAPEDLQTLVIVSSLMSQRPPQGAQAAREHWEKVEGYAKNAVVQAEAFLEGPDGAELDPAQKAANLARVHSTLGLVHFQQEEYADAIQAYEAAVAAVAEPVSYYILGLSYNNAQQMDDASPAFARAVYLELPDARGALEQIYELKNGSLEGLEAYIQEEGQKIGG